MFEIPARFKGTNGADAFETKEDLGVRNFAYLYEPIGLMEENGLVDLELVLDTQKYLVVRDWQVFEPHAKFVISKYPVQFNAWGWFEWPAKEAREHLEREHSPTPPRQPRNTT